MELAIGEEFPNSMCNVLAAPKLVILGGLELGLDGSLGSDLMWGDMMITTTPYAMATRNDDREFSDTVNWVLQSLFYGDEQGLLKDASRCQKYTSLPAHVAQLNFMNAMYCIGSYGQILKEYEEQSEVSSSDINKINYGTTGMLYATPLGEYKIKHSADVAPLNAIKNKGPLKCGVVIPDGFDGNITSSDALLGMSVDYCQAVAAGLFDGKADYVSLTTFSLDNGFVALDEGVIDLLSGGKAEKQYDFASPSLGRRGFDFSTPYYYGNEAAR